MKKIRPMILLLFGLMVFSSVALAATDIKINTNKMNAAVGDEIIVSGTAVSNTWISIRGIDSGGNIVYFSAVLTGSTGVYSQTIKVPEMSDGILAIVAGNSSGTATTNITIQASSGGSTGSSGSGSTIPPPTENKTPVSGNNVTATTVVAASIDSSGNAAVKVTQEQVSDALGKALTAAKKQGEGTVATVEIRITQADNSKSVESNIPIGALNELTASDSVSLKISTPIASIIFDQQSLDAISRVAANDVQISIARTDPKTLLSSNEFGQKEAQEFKDIIGDRPVFNFSVTSGKQAISHFGGNVTVAVPYMPQKDENLNAIVIYYIGAGNKLEIVRNGIYNPATGTVSFSTNHFSMYAIGYNPVYFTDVPTGAWYREAVGFLAARDICTGMGDGTYRPDQKLTRAQSLVMTMRGLGIEPDNNVKDNFVDAGNTYYTGYLAAAKRLGITRGVGDNRFAPQMEIKRQEMFTLMYAAMKATGELPSKKALKSMDSFSDAHKIAPWAMDSIEMFVTSGIISGDRGRLLTTDRTTRAQAAQVLYKILVN